MSFHIDRIEIIALRKLELVSKSLATKLSGTAGREQKCLADCLGQVLDRYEIEAEAAKSLRRKSRGYCKTL